MAAGDVAYKALLEAMRFTDPACRGDDRFILDDLPESDLVQMRGLCRVCPLRELCAAYANEVRPSGGVWAGKQRQGLRRDGEKR